MQEFLTIKETCLLVNVSYPSLLRMIKANKIPVIKIGKAIRIPKSFLMKLESEAIHSYTEEAKA